MRAVRANADGRGVFQTGPSVRHALPLCGQRRCGPLALGHHSIDTTALPERLDGQRVGMGIGARQQRRKIGPAQLILRGINGQ